MDDHNQEANDEQERGSEMRSVWTLDPAKWPLKTKHALACNNIHWLQDLFDAEPKDIEKLESITGAPLSIMIHQARNQGHNEPKFFTGLELMQKEQGMKPLVTLCKSMDEALEGGLYPGEFIEIYGEAGSGKSQLCFQLSVNTFLPLEYGGFNGSCLYIDTEGSFESKRVAELVDNLLPNINEVRPSQTTQPRQYTRSDFLDSIRVNTCKSHVELVKLLTIHLEGVLRAIPKVKTIIVDSIAFPFRYQEMNREITTGDQTEALLSIIRSLRHIARTKEILVVVVNQVTSDPNLQLTLPSLGGLWRGGCYKRIFLENLGDRTAMGCGPRRRQATVLKSSFTSEPFNYQITSEGFTDYID